ncbi:DUF4493 domain-containing protein [Aureibacter tunicatorum]|uniref:DUF4493 domain-containing protein n=1 Tax=Aureibacter tunicatorum TaxID=866807 RepID=A0AAE3XM33_9BACT|nr:DUF4493 domain-containing protein [Aureibacter tunicatorum]MDR6239447.1 hypothetical protein [Aureibacter tunicatorum]BDD04630.1 hypothetical protein AUTU_21130 [Aureibacter tunicatorum]
MKAIVKIIFTLLTASFFCACNMLEYEPNGSLGIGELRMSLSNNNEVIELSASSRKSENLNVEDFRVQVRDSHGLLVKNYERYGEMPVSIALSGGNYTITAESMPVPNAGFDMPYYLGEKEFTITTGEISQIDLECTLGNMMVTIDYAEDFNQYFSSYEATVSNGLGSLVFQKSESRAGYFSVAPLTIVLNVDPVDGEAFEKVYKIEDVAPRDYHKIVFKPRLGQGGVALEIEVDTSTNDKDIDIEIPNDNDENSIEGIGFDIKEVVQVERGIKDADVRVLINAATGIDKLEIEIISDKLTPEALAELNLQSEFDLANLEKGSELEASLKALGFIGDEPIKGQTEVVFDISAFMEPLGLFGLDTHDFVVRMTDLSGESLQETLSIEIVESK